MFQVPIIQLSRHVVYVNENSKRVERTPSQIDRGIADGGEEIMNLDQEDTEEPKKPTFLDDLNSQRDVMDRPRRLSNVADITSGAGNKKPKVIHFLLTL